MKPKVAFAGREYSIEAKKASISFLRLKQAIASLRTGVYRPAAAPI